MQKLHNFIPFFFYQIRFSELLLSKYTQLVHNVMTDYYYLEEKNV